MGERPKSLKTLIAVAGTLIPAVALAGAASPANARPLVDSPSGALLQHGVYAKDQFTLGAPRLILAQYGDRVTTKPTKKVKHHNTPPPRRHHAHR
jgi:hypothetical protein